MPAEGTNNGGSTLNVSVSATLVTRAVIVGLLALICWFGQSMLADIKSDLHEVRGLVVTVGKHDERLKAVEREQGKLWDTLRGPAKPGAIAHLGADGTERTR